MSNRMLFLKYILLGSGVGNKEHIAVRIMKLVLSKSLFKLDYNKNMINSYLAVFKKIKKYCI